MDFIPIKPKQLRNVGLLWGGIGLLSLGLTASKADTPFKPDSGKFAGIPPPLLSIKHFAHYR